MPLLKDDEVSRILRELLVAEPAGLLEIRAAELAKEYNLSINQIYQLWFGPEDSEGYPVLPLPE